MYNFMSFYIHDSGKIALGNLRDYTRIAELENIDEKDTKWHKAKWTGEGADTIFFPNDSAKDKLIDKIITRWKTRSEFFEWAAPQLIELDCSYTGINFLPELPKCEWLNCSGNFLTFLPKLLECKWLHCYNNKIITLPELPKCEILNCSNNNLTALPKLPECEWLNCAYNNLTMLPELPKCDWVYFPGTKIKS